ncbi:MAG: hypothetical protein WC340_10285, partial [Kiritimatiellia bacterium]
MEIDVELATAAFAVPPLQSIRRFPTPPQVLTVTERTRGEIFFFNHEILLLIFRFSAPSRILNAHAFRAPLC